MGYSFAKYDAEAPSLGQDFRTAKAVMDRSARRSSPLLQDSHADTDQLESVTFEMSEELTPQQIIAKIERLMDRHEIYAAMDLLHSVFQMDDLDPDLYELAQDLAFEGLEYMKQRYMSAECERYSRKLVPYLEQERPENTHSQTFKIRRPWEDLDNHSALELKPAA